MKKRLTSYLRIYFTAIIILLSLVVVVWLCGCVVVRSRGRAGVWCGFCGCHFSFFSFRFLHIGTYRLPPLSIAVLSAGLPPPPPTPGLILVGDPSSIVLQNAPVFHFSFFIPLFHLPVFSLFIFLFRYFFLPFVASQLHGAVLMN